MNAFFTPHPFAPSLSEAKLGRSPNGEFARASWLDKLTTNGEI
jgi:hypothetical protein